MKLRTAVSLCAPFLLLAGCDRLTQESKKKPDAPVVAEPAAPPQVAAKPEATQSTTPEPSPAPAAEPSPKPFRVGGEVTRPVVIHKVPLDLAGLQNREVRLTGVIIAEAVIDEKGNVKNARTLKGSDPDINAKVLAAILQWKFKPATLNGKPVPVYYTVTVNIHLQ